MNQAACEHCRSAQVTVVDSNEAEQTVTVHCLSCGRDSVIHGGSFDVDIGDLPVE